MSGFVALPKQMVGRRLRSTGYVHVEKKEETRETGEYQYGMQMKTGGGTTDTQRRVGVGVGETHGGENIFERKETSG